jgi:hypothetical protein
MQLLAVSQRLKLLVTQRKQRRLCEVAGLG